MNKSLAFNHLNLVYITVNMRVFKLQSPWPVSKTVKFEVVNHHSPHSWSFGPSFVCVDVL